MELTLAATTLSVDGTLAGPIFTHRRDQLVARRPYPAANPSAAQTRVRDAWRTVDGAWRALPLTNRQAWNNYRKWAKLYGYNWWMRINLPRYLAGLPLLDLPPLLY